MPRHGRAAAGARRLVFLCVGALLLAGVGCGPAPVPPGDELAPAAVTLTWLSVTNWLLEAGDTRILLDAYVGRIDRATVEDDGSSSAPARPDTATVRAVRDAVLPDGDLDLILVGHGHWDHALDAPAWAALTGAPIAGARTVCLQAHAFAIDDCTPVEGGETFEPGPFVHVRAVRWHHSGDSTTASGRRLRAPLELTGPLMVDPATGGLQPGFLADYPNGGGSRAWLITVRTVEGPVTIFWSSTGNPQAWDAPVPADSAWFREQGIALDHFEWAADAKPTRDHLTDALSAEGLDRVDAWIGFGTAAHVRQVTPVLRQRAFLPHHWDDFWLPIPDGVTRPFDPTSLLPILDSASARIFVPGAVFDRFRVSGSGMEALGGVEAARRYGRRFIP